MVDSVCVLHDAMRCDQAPPHDEVHGWGSYECCTSSFVIVFPS